MSRSAKPRDQEIQKFSNVRFVKGNCLDSNTFRDHLEGVNAIIHCVGTLIEKKGNPDLSYESMNRDTAINMAGELQDLAVAQKKNKNFVYISSEKAPPFLEKYLTTKLEAESYILSEECANLKPTIIRPGFIYDKNHRWWSMPLKTAVDLAWLMNEKVYKKTPFAKQVDFLFPAKSVQLSTVAHFAIEGAMGNTNEKIITNDMLLEFE